jgi:type IV pilus assembly protein PilC
VTTGVALSDAFLALGDTFPRLYANSLRAGERSGELEQVIGRFVEYQRLVESVRKKIVAALTYPAILVTLAIGLVLVLMTYVIPSFSTFYVQFESELPLPTRLVIGLANTMRDNWLLMVVGLVAGIYGLRLWRSSPSGRMITDRWRLRVPLVGRLSQLFALSQFSRSLAILLGGGTPMVPALETASTSVSNAFISELFLGCVQEVQ